SVVYFFLILSTPPRPSLFPYTTLFRSRPDLAQCKDAKPGQLHPALPGPAAAWRRAGFVVHRNRASIVRSSSAPEEERHVASHVRSEEHTSELQSPDHLVCRLLLEKKKR